MKNKGLGTKPGDLSYNKWTCDDFKLLLILVFSFGGGMLLMLLGIKELRDLIVYGWVW